LTITGPLNGANVSALTKLYWSTPDQTNYQVRRVADNAGAPDTGTIYWDSGEIASTNDREANVAYPINDRWEHVQVRIKAYGLWSVWADSRVNVSWTPPASPIVKTTPLPESGSVYVEIDNPVPLAGEPGVLYNDIYRFVGDIPKKVSTVPPDGIYIDYTANGESQYLVRAYGANDVTSESIMTTTLTLHGIWLHDPLNTELTIHRFAWDAGRSTDWIPEMAMMEYVGRQFQVAEFGEGVTESINMGLPLDQESGDVAAMEILAKLRTILCYRDGRGRKIFGVIAGLPTDDTYYGNVMKFQFNRVDYNEFPS